MDNEEQGAVTTSVMSPVDLVYDGWMIMEASQVWSDLRYRVGTDDRRSNISLRSPGFGTLLVAVPTVDDPPEPPREIEGFKVVPLEEFLYGILQINTANETIRKQITLTLLD